MEWICLPTERKISVYSIFKNCNIDIYLTWKSAFKGRLDEREGRLTLGMSRMSLMMHSRIDDSVTMGSVRRRWMDLWGRCEGGGKKIISSRKIMWAPPSTSVASWEATRRSMCLQQWHGKGRSSGSHWGSRSAPWSQHASSSWVAAAVWGTSAPRTSDVLHQHCKEHWKWPVVTTRSRQEHRLWNTWF